MPKSTPETAEQTPDAKVDTDALLQTLAALTPIAYDQQRESAAKLIGVRTSTLDSEVAARRQQAEQEASPSLIEVSLAPWDEQVDGAELLDDLAHFYERFLILPSGGAWALALWVLHTYLLGVIQVSPRLGILSPQKRCGKTTLMDLIQATVYRGLSTVNVTASVLFRVIEQWQPTMLMDEVDTFIPENEDLRGIVNAGHRKNGAQVFRNVQLRDNWEPRGFSVWGAVAIAMIGNPPGTILDRSILLRMRRKAPGETVERLRLDRIQGKAEKLRRRCLRWAQDHMAALKESDPVIPETLNDRAADNWRPLCGIAERAGGEWPQRVQHAMKALATEDVDNETASILLLQDIKTIFEQYGSIDAELKVRALSSKQIVQYLHDIEERPWSEWGRQHKPMTERQLGDVLRPFEIRSNTIRFPDDTIAKGYRVAQFTDAWERYIPSPHPKNDNSAVTPLQLNNGAAKQHSSSVTDMSTTSVTPLQLNNGAGMSSNDPLQPSNGAIVTDHNARKPAPMAACNGVTDRVTDRVTDHNARKPAPMAACNGVTDKNVENGGSGGMPPSDDDAGWSKYLTQANACGEESDNEVAF